MNDLKVKQSLPLSYKIILTEKRLDEFYIKMKGKIYVSFSGGKDSTVLLDIVRKKYPSIPAVFCNTGIEFPEILKFVKTFENITWLKPKMNFWDIVKKYGYPIISKIQAQYINQWLTTKSEYMRNLRWNGNEKKYWKIAEKWKPLAIYAKENKIKISAKCCDILKKNPAKQYEKETGNFPIIGTMASESKLRKDSWEKHGCNAFDLNRPISRPLSVWTDEDIWQYIKEKSLPYASIYDKGYDRTGCVTCAFGIGRDTERFEKLKETHPKLYDCWIKKKGYDKIINMILFKNQNSIISNLEKLRNKL